MGWIITGTTWVAVVGAAAVADAGAAADTAADGGGGSVDDAAVASGGAGFACASAVGAGFRRSKKPPPMPSPATISRPTLTATMSGFDEAGGDCIAACERAIPPAVALAFIVVCDLGGSGMIACARSSGCEGIEDIGSRGCTCACAAACSGTIMLSWMLKPFVSSGRIAASISAALWNRSLGLRWSAPWTTAATCGDTHGANSCTGARRP